MVIIEDQSLHARLYREATNVLNNARLESSHWEFVGSNGYGGSISTPFLEISVGYTLNILQLKEKRPDVATTHSFGLQSLDTGVGIGAIPFNATFPLPDFPGTGKVLMMPRSGSLTKISFLGLFYGFTMGAQVFGMNGSLNFTFFIPKVTPKPNLLNPGAVWHAGAIVVSLQSGGGLSPGDAGVVSAIGISAG